MTFESYANRLTKHFNQILNRRPHSTNMDLETIDLTPRFPRLSWVNAKTRSQGNGGRSGNSGHLPEHILANADNRNPYQGPDKKWYWYDETEQACEIAYETRAAALVALDDYCKWLNTPHEIGGISEVGGLPTEGTNVTASNESEDNQRTDQVYPMQETKSCGEVQQD